MLPAHFAGVAELADAMDSKSISPKGSVGSIPSSGILFTSTTSLWHGHLARVYLS